MVADVNTPVAGCARDGEQRDRAAEVGLVRALENAAHHAPFKAGARTIVDLVMTLLTPAPKSRPTQSPFAGGRVEEGVQVVVKNIGDGVAGIVPRTRCADDGASELGIAAAPLRRCCDFSLPPTMALTT